MSITDITDGYGHQEEYGDGQAVVRRQGSRAAAIVRQVGSDRFGHRRYSVRHDDGSRGIVSSRDLRPLRGGGTANHPLTGV